MTLEDIRRVLVSADPEIRHYWQMGTGADYTWWQETQMLPLTGDDKHDEGWAFQVHRFTMDEYDPIKSIIREVLEEDPRIAFRYLVDTEEDTGYIHHIFDCEAY